MKRKFQRKILSETRRVAVVLNSHKQEVLNCEICDEDYVLLSPNIVAKFLKISTRKIYQLIESGQVHFYESKSRELLVCVNSVENSLKVVEGKLLKK